MKPTRAIALIAFVLCLGTPARAADWGYCIAPADADNRIFISRPFPSDGPKAEGEFEDSLDRRHLRHDAVECPRADDQATAVVMHQHAVDVNRLWGRQVVDIPMRASP
jgi:hypothetical protein